MRNLNLLSSQKLSSLLFCSALGTCVFPGCSAKVNGYVSMGGDTGGTGTSQGTGEGITISAGGTSPVGGATSVNQTTVPLDVSRLSTGDNNAVSSGGYWWTYVDNNGPGSQYHASISQITGPVVALQPTLDSDSSHGNVLKVSGFVPGSFPWTDVSAQVLYTIDVHWASIYADAMIPAYPAAGIGFSFLHFSRPFDATGGGKWVGIAFDMKVNLDMPEVWVSMPMVGTDLPDPSVGLTEDFPKLCQYYTAANPPATGGESCFTHYRQGIFSTTLGNATPYNTLAAVGTWKRYCVLYADVAVPNWANAVTMTMLPAFDPTQLLKVQWDMHQPLTGSANFDISLDNVSLVSAAQAQDAANNCNVSRIGAPYGSGNAG